jgi:hypothetical protein
VKNLAQRLAVGVGGSLLAGMALFFGAQIVTANDGTALLGSRQVAVRPDQERVEVGALFGSVNVVVPDGVRVRVAGRVVFGGTEEREEAREDAEDAAENARERAEDARDGG